MTVTQHSQSQRSKLNRFLFFLLVFCTWLSLLAAVYSKRLLPEKSLQIELPTLAKRKTPHMLSLSSYLPFQSISYTVNASDTLSSLAQNYKTSEETLKLLNNNLSPFIRNGEKLLLPNQAGIVHQVSSGESLLQIARKYDTTLAKILDTNELTTATVQPNTLLFIPQQQPLEPKEVFLTPLRHNNSSPPLQIANNYFFERTAAALSIPARYNQTVYAVSSGSIAKVSYHPHLGRYLLLQQRNFFILYAYLTAIEVEEGQKIAASQPLAKVGKQFEQEENALLYFALIKGRQTINSGSYPEDLQKILARLGASASRNQPPITAGWEKILF